MALPKQGFPRRLALLGLLVLGLGVAIGFGNMLASFAQPDWVAHVVGHGSVALAALVACYGASRLGRAPGAPRGLSWRAGRAATLLGLLAYALTLAAEAVAAYVDGGAGAAPHAFARRTGVVVFAGTLLGLAAWTWSAAQAFLLPRWAPLAVGVAALYVVYAATRALGLFGLMP